MTRATVRRFFSAAVLLAVGTAAQLTVAQRTIAQDAWNHGFGPRNYGYNGNPYAQSYADPGYSNNYSNNYSSNYSNYGGLGFGYNSTYVTGFSPYYGVYPYYAYDGVAFGVYPNGYYNNYYAPYGNYLPYRGARANPNARAPNQKQPKKQPQGVKKNADKKTPLSPAIAF